MDNLYTSIVFVAALILSTMTFSCSKEELPDRECNLSSIKGSWDWVETTGLLAGGRLTPSNTGLTMRLEINDTVWNEYTNDSLTRSTQYTFTQDTNTNFFRGRVDFGSPLSIPIRIHNCSMLIEGLWDDSPDIIYEYLE